MLSRLSLWARRVLGEASGLQLLAGKVPRRPRWSPALRHGCKEHQSVQTVSDTRRREGAGGEVEVQTVWLSRAVHWREGGLGIPRAKKHSKHLHARQGQREVRLAKRFVSIGGLASEDVERCSWRREFSIMCFVLWCLPTSFLR